MTIDMVAHRAIEQGLTGWRLVRYLNSIGLEGHHSERATVFELKPARPVLVPTDPSSPDYSALLALAVDGIASGLRQVPSDIVEAALALGKHRLELILGGGSGTASTSLAAFESGVEATHRTLLMSASSESGTMGRRFHSGPYPSEASEFIADVRVGHTKAGSYVVPLLIDADWKASTAVSDDFDLAAFPERVLERFEIVIRAALAAADGFEAGESFARTFEDSVLSGVNAQICDSLAELSAATSEGVRFHIEWASGQHPRGPLSIAVAPGYSGVLHAAADRLRSGPQTSPAVVVGRVELLDRGVDEDVGTVGIRAMTGRGHFYYVDLSDRDYTRAIEAHQSKRPVIVSGVVEMHGRRRIIQQVEGFSFAQGVLPMET